MTLRIAAWSGPRNLSTALMYSFASRADTTVSDEPLYAHYLAQTGLDHPMRDAVIASQSTDPAVLVEALTGSAPTPVWYQKHMAHHLLPELGTDWLDALRHLVLLRHPRAIVASYQRKRARFDAADLGIGQLDALARTLEARGLEVVVLDTDALLVDPEGALRRVCGRLGIGFDPAMLTWEAGGHEADGVWAPHWYRAVHRSTGFGPPQPVPTGVGAHEPLVRALLPAYERLLERV